MGRRIRHQETNNQEYFLMSGCGFVEVIKPREPLQGSPYDYENLLERDAMYATQIRPMVKDKPKAENRIKRFFRKLRLAA